MRILLIEDDAVWMSQLQRMLEENVVGVELECASSVSEAKKKLGIFIPDVVVADILLKDGFAFEISEQGMVNYPIVYITAFANQYYLQLALKQPNATFLVKPFHELTLVAALQKVIKKNDSGNGQASLTISIIDKFRQRLEVPFEEITFIEADGNYVRLHTIRKKVYSYKSSLKELIQLLDTRFVQIHKSIIINTAYAMRMDLTAGEVMVGGVSLPIGRAHRKNAIQHLKIILG